jgi:hypothetical protein
LKTALPEQARGVSAAVITAMLTGVGTNPVAVGVELESVCARTPSSLEDER